MKVEKSCSTREFNKYRFATTKLSIGANIAVAGNTRVQIPEGTKHTIPLFSAPSVQFDRKRQMKANEATNRVSF